MIYPYYLPVDERTNDLPVACPRLCMVMICARRETSENGTAERESGKDKVEINSWTVLVTATATGQFHLHRCLPRCLPRRLPALLDSCAGCGGSEECQKYGGTTSSKHRVFLPRLRHSFFVRIFTSYINLLFISFGVTPESSTGPSLCVFNIVIIDHCHWTLCVFNIVIIDHCHWTLCVFNIVIIVIGHCVYLTF